MVRVLASGSGGNAVLLGEDKPLLLDAGLPFRTLRTLLGFKVTKLAACAVTHEHQDHARAVGNLLKMGVSVLASRGTLEALGIADHYRVAALKHNDMLTTHEGRGAWGVIGYHVEHDAAEPMALYAGRGNLRVLYITDAGSFQPPTNIRPTHVLIEANHRREELEVVADFDEHAARVARTHLSVEDAIDTLGHIDLSACREIHLLHMSDRNADVLSFQEDVRVSLGGRVPVFTA